MRLLVTNDDGVESPLLPILLGELSRHHEVIAVVPVKDQSWRGKSMTCFSEVPCVRRSVCGCEVYVLDGTPADCANIGLHHLVPGPVDLLVSGINIGVNSGIGFMLSSGTLGACLEANIAKVPAIGLSQAMPREAMLRYRGGGGIELDRLGGLRSQLQLIGCLMRLIGEEPECVKEPWTFSFNFPSKLNQDSKVALSRLGLTLYGSAFVRRDGYFKHELGDVFVDKDERADALRISAGMITLTPIDLRTIGQTKYGPELEGCARAAERLGERINSFSFS